MYGKVKSFSTVGLIAILFTTIYTAILITITYSNKKKIDSIYRKEIEGEENWDMH